MTDGTMKAMTHTREDAWTLLNEWTKSSSLIKHALAVECCVRAYGEKEAARLGLAGVEADALVERYSVTGLLHDFDYDKHPSLEEHPFVGVAHLRELGWPDEVLHAILAHADYSGTPRESHLDRALFACDELAGFLTACALVKPSKSIHEVDVAGVKKKMKDKAFARAVKREDIISGAELLSVPVDEHVGFCVAAMRKSAKELGLEGISGSSGSI